MCKANLSLCSQSQRPPAAEMQTSRIQTTARHLPKPELVKNELGVTQAQMHTPNFFLQLLQETRGRVRGGWGRMQVLPLTLVARRALLIF